MDLLKTLEEDSAPDQIATGSGVHQQTNASDSYFDEKEFKNCGPNLDESIASLQENPNIETVFLEDEIDIPEYIHDVKSLLNTSDDNGSVENSLKDPLNSIPSNKDDNIVEKCILKPPNGSHVRTINFNAETKQPGNSNLQILPPKVVMRNAPASTNNLFVVLTPTTTNSAVQSTTKVQIDQKAAISPAKNSCPQKVPTPLLKQSNTGVDPSPYPVSLSFPSAHVKREDKQLKKSSNTNVVNLIPLSNSPAPARMLPTETQKPSLHVKCQAVTFKGQKECRNYMYVPKCVNTYDASGQKIELELVQSNNRLSYRPKPKSGNANMSLPIDSVKLQIGNVNNPLSVITRKEEDGSCIVNSPSVNSRGSEDVKDPVILILDSDDEKPNPQNTITPSVFTKILRDKQFKCWSYPARKRDLSGFAITDALGFNASEKERGRRCMRNVENACKTLQNSLNNLHRQYRTFRSDTEDNIFGKVTIVEVDEIKRVNRGKHKVSQRVQMPYSRTSKANQKKQGPGRPRCMKPVSSREKTMEDSSLESELLLTKKVVILNGQKQSHESHRGIHGKRRNKSRQVNPYKRQYPFKRKTSFVDPIPKGVVDNYNRYQLKPCYVEIRPNKLVMEALDRYYAEKFDDTLKRRFYNVFNRKLIRDLKDFQMGLSNSKALVILNERNVEGMEFETSYPKYDLVFPVGSNCNVSESLIRNSYFVDCVEKDYIMLVDSEILSKHLLGKTYHM